MDLNLNNQYDDLKERSLQQLFLEHPERAQTFCIDVAGLRFDFSKNHLTEETLNALCHFAEKQGLTEAIKALLSGDMVNNTEQRPALHSALRAPADQSDTSHQAQAALDKMASFIEAIEAQTWLGYKGDGITDIINIGIGGSDLGPRMVTQALSDFHTPRLKVHFVANVDGADLADTLASLNPANTLCIVASKSFTTLETLNNALSARQWYLDKGCPEADLHKHFVAISSNIEAASQFGIAEDNIFPMWDWVGGRYSLWSAIGLPIAFAVGMDHFNALLAGAHSMDQHFANTPFHANMPVVAALLSHWYGHYWGSHSHAVLPYAQRLSRLPAYLQQLDMESLGKRVDKAGIPLDMQSGQVIWGAEGTNGQHSFHQLLHQGTRLIPVDFIAIKQAMSAYDEQHQHLLACCISQSQALLQGKSLSQAEDELKQQGLDQDAIRKLAPHKVIPGNRPSNLIIMDKLSPGQLGALIAFYEHKVYVSSILLGINAFDQWGVELGKQLGKPLYEALISGEVDTQWDSSTVAAINYLRKN